MAHMLDHNRCYRMKPSKGPVLQKKWNIGHQDMFTAGGQIPAAVRFTETKSYT